MARRTQVIVEDDLDGSPAHETLNFTFDGITYEIDLNQVNATQLRDAMNPWVRHARRVSGRRPRGHNARPGTSTEVRLWAIAQGMNVSRRGRIPQDIKDAYAAAH